MKSDKEYNEPMLAIESLSDGLSTATGSWRFVFRLKPSLNFWRREVFDREESESWAFSSSRNPLGGVSGREGEEEREIAESEGSSKLFDFLGSGMVFRLVTGEDGESAKYTRFEESWRFSSWWGTRIDARSTGAETRRTGVVLVEEYTDLRCCLGTERGFLVSDASEGAEAGKNAGKSHPNQMARRL